MVDLVFVVVVVVVPQFNYWPMLQTIILHVNLWNEMNKHEFILLYDAKSVY